MSEKNSKLEKLKAENDLLKASAAVKDRLIIEFITVLTAQKIVIPSHVLSIIQKLYPGKLEILNEIDELIEADQIEREQQEQVNEQKEERPRLRVVE